MPYAHKCDDSDIELRLETVGYVCARCQIAPLYYGEDPETGLGMEERCSLVFETPHEAIQHLFSHVRAGHKVPEGVFLLLVADCCVGVEVI